MFRPYWLSVCERSEPDAGLCGVVMGIERSALCRSREPEPEAGGTPGGGFFKTPSFREI
jgi:hypothetical protein